MSFIVSFLMLLSLFFQDKGNKKPRKQRQYKTQYPRLHYVFIIFEENLITSKNVNIIILFYFQEADAFQWEP